MPKNILVLEKIELIILFNSTFDNFTSNMIKGIFSFVRRKSTDFYFHHYNFSASRATHVIHTHL